VARVNAGTGVGQLVQVQAGAKLPALDGSNLTNVTASAVANNSIGSAQIVDGSITNADIASLAWSKLTGTPTTLAGYGVTDAIKNLGTIPGASSGLDAAKPASPALGELYIAVDTGKIYRWDGTSTWAVMATKDGSGITSLNGLTSSTQTFAIGTSGNSPAFSSVTSTHTLNIPLASTAGVTAGLISKTDYDNFNIKLGAVSNTASLAATKVWIGNASGVAQEFALSGDATMTSGGVVTVDKSQTAAASKILQLDANSVAVTKGEDIGGASTGKVSLRYPSTAANTTLTLPSSAGSASQFLQTDGAGNLSWASPSSSLPALASTQVWVGNASGAAAEVSLSGDISSITSAGAVTVNKTTTAQANKLLSLDGSGIATSMGNQLNGTTSGSVTLQAAGATTNYSLTFPAVQGSSGQILSNNGSGVLSWVTPVSSSTGFINGGNSFGANSSLGNNDNFNLDLKTNNTSRMTILNTGNVGIGTTSPGSKLTVVTSATGDGVSVIGNTAGDGAPQFSLAATGTTASGSLGLALASPNWSAISVPNDLVLRTIDAPSGGNLILANQNASGGIFFTTGSSWTNDTAKMTILNGGNVGVGTTNPGQKLSVAGTVESTSGGFKFPDGTTQTTAATGGSSQWTSSGSNIYYNTGSIGIGTSTPNTLIHSYFTGSGYNNIFKSENTTTDTNSGNGFVAQNGSSYISMYNQTYRTTDYTPFNQAVVVRSAGAKLSIGSSDTQPVLFSTNASERMRIDSAGNVGIGTTSPGSTLDMKGTLRLSGSTSGYVGFAPAAAAGSATYTLPTTQGTAGQVLSTDGVAGTPTLSWVTPSGTSQWITTGSDIYYNTGKVGVGTTAPRASLDVQGGAIIGAPTGGDVGAGPVDFSTGNLKYTTNSCGSFALRNMKDGGAYTFVVKGATAATCTFTAYSDNGSTALTMHLAPDNGNTTASKHTVFTFIVLGTDVYMSWIPGY
ncbi:MAG: beta strand repeat-containing protein, partial [Pseudobdellovibrionaceae bacterium]